MLTLKKFFKNHATPTIKEISNNLIIHLFTKILLQSQNEHYTINLTISNTFTVNIPYKALISKIVYIKQHINGIKKF